MAQPVSVKHIDSYTLDWFGPAPFKAVRKMYDYECPSIVAGGSCYHSYVHHTALHEDGECERFRPGEVNCWWRNGRLAGPACPWPEFSENQ